MVISTVEYLFPHLHYNTISHIVATTELRFCNRGTRHLLPSVQASSLGSFPAVISLVFILLPVLVFNKVLVLALSVACFRWRYHCGVLLLLTGGFPFHFSALFVLRFQGAFVVISFLLQYHFFRDFFLTSVMDKIDVIQVKLIRAKNYAVIPTQTLYSRTRMTEFLDGSSVEPTKDKAKALWIQNKSTVIT
ncbi:hypothetical protein MRB53_026740 [Persea americana]|uniref:Uncharacterized protein n=1 Tax=Persea americana TaxID=3435 RepID=A0ACC2LK31_PERAE|nr:hypothetical protein MRB53_026740 [Persea americana]